MVRLWFNLKPVEMPFTLLPICGSEDALFKGSPAPTHFTFEIIVGKSRSMSDPTFSDNDFIKWNGLGLNYP